jgi:putative oxidoreductase
MSSLMKTVDQFYALFLKIANSLQSPFLLAVRLYWGWQFLQSGWGKLTHISTTIENFTNMGVPAPAFNAHFIGLVETVGGVLLLLGLASRLIAVPLIINMTMAYVIGDREALQSIFSEPDKFYGAAPYTFLFAAIIVLVFGPGYFSLDTLIAKRRAKARTAEA